MNKKIDVYLAGPRGFCAGVERAILMVEKAIKKYGKPVYVRHEIVHNKFVVDNLKNNGAIFIEELNEIKDIGKRIEYSIHEYFEKSNIENPTTGFDWEYILIDNDKIKNAWCMPGGKIAVYTGILEVTKNEDGLAAVMGHEIAHAVAKHSVERASRAMVLNVGTAAIDIFTGGAISNTQRTTGVDVSGMLRAFGIDFPFGRKQETEADYLGIIFSSLAGYNIEESYKVWERMKEEGGSGPAEFWSTHPSPDNRIKKLKEWIPIVSRQYPAIG